MNANAATEKKNDLEYQYSEDQLTEKPAKEPIIQADLPVEKPARFSRKKIILGIVICAMVGAIFQFLNHRDKAAEYGSQQEIEAAAKASKQQQPIKPVAVKKPVEPVAEKPVEAPKPKPAPVEKKLEEIFKPEPVKEAPATSAKYDSEINGLQSGLSEVNQSVSGLQKTLTTLAASVQTLSNQVEQLNKEQEKQKAAAAKPEVKIDYYLKSIITGRAWVESEAGELTTVKVGDELPGYGKITAINPEDGLVDTSSGTAIKFAPGDS
jgi:type IV secretory pathway VirB10-like protein